MTATSVRAAFDPKGIVLALDRLLPTKQLKETLKKSTKYCAILASIREVGIIEPLIVYPQKGGKYLLLDGHARVEALKEIGTTETLCLVSTDDEGYTYNHEVNPVAPIQANRMILKAVEAGVPEARIAKALNLSLTTVRHSRAMLKDICPEAVDMLKDKLVGWSALQEFKKVKAMRQIEMAELMVAAGTYSGSYARALVIATSKDSMVDPIKPKKIPGVKPEDMARMEHEMRALEKDFLLIEETYGRNVYDLTLAVGYVKKILDNGRVVRYLAQKYKDLLPELQRVVESAALEG